MIVSGRLSGIDKQTVIGLGEAGAKVTIMTGPQDGKILTY